MQSQFNVQLYQSLLRKCSCYGVQLSFCKAGHISLELNAPPKFLCAQHGWSMCVHSVASIKLLQEDHRLVVMQGAMPPAQGLVVMMHLQEGTRPLAGRLASLLLRLYVLCIIPLSLWSALFLVSLGNPI